MQHQNNAKYRGGNINSISNALNASQGSRRTSNNPLCMQLEKFYLSRKIFLLQDKSMLNTIAWSQYAIYSQKA